MAALSRATRIVAWGIVLLLLVLVIVKTVFIGYHRISENAMYPALPSGSTLFAAKRAYASPAQVKRGDIIVLTLEEDGTTYTYVRRVIGLPGDRIKALGDTLSLNERTVKREQVREDQGLAIFREEIDGAAYEVALRKSSETQPPPTALTVPADHFFVMGDHRYDARDSRDFGPIPFKAIIGRKL